MVRFFGVLVLYKGKERKIIFILEYIDVLWNSLEF